MSAWGVLGSSGGDGLQLDTSAAISFAAEDAACAAAQRGVTCALSELRVGEVLRRKEHAGGTRGHGTDTAVGAMATGLLRCAAFARSRSCAARCAASARSMAANLSASAAFAARSALSTRSRRSASFGPFSLRCAARMRCASGSRGGSGNDKGGSVGSSVGTVSSSYRKDVVTCGGVGAHTGRFDASGADDGQKPAQITSPARRSSSSRMRLSR